MSTTKPWFVTVAFRSDVGEIEVDYMVDDVAEMFQIIEDGPGMEAVVTIVKRRSRPEDAITVQESYERRGMLAHSKRRTP